MIPRILVIDDEERMCWALERALSHEGYQVLTATWGQQGINLAQEAEPSMVILDLKMPDIDGIEVLKRIKGIHPDIPVIMITAHGTNYILFCFAIAGMMTRAASIAAIVSNSATFHAEPITSSSSFR